MLLEKFHFGEFREIEPNIIEAIIYEGVELDRLMIETVRAVFNERYRGPYVILSNRIHRYSHTHDSMLAVADDLRLRGLGILVYSAISSVAAGIHEIYQDNVRVFHVRETALEWLRQALITERIALPRLGIPLKPLQY